jgi:hypothetical protein
MRCNSCQKESLFNLPWRVRHALLRCLCLAGLPILFLTAGCQIKHDDNPPVIQYTPLPTQAPVQLETTTIEKFVDWVSTMPSSQVPDVKEQIAKVASDSVLIDAIAGKLSFDAPGSYGRQLIYLSILGEMRNTRALGPLQAYLNSGDCPVFEERSAVLPVSGSGNTTYFDSCAGLKSTAVNMIAYINTTLARNIVLQAVRSHPSRAVRLSAMNSYLYNNNDSAEALELVKQYARGNEVRFVGLPRLAPQHSLKDFNERVARFYEKYPEERPQPVPAPAPPKPVKTDLPPHTQNPRPTSAGGAGG